MRVTTPALMSTLSCPCSIAHTASISSSSFRASLARMASPSAELGTAWAFRLLSVSREVTPSEAKRAYHRCAPEQRRLCKRAWRVLLEPPCPLARPDAAGTPGCSSARTQTKAATRQPSCGCAAGGRTRCARMRSGADATRVNRYSKLFRLCSKTWAAPPRATGTGVRGALAPCQAHELRSV